MFILSSVVLLFIFVVFFFFFIFCWNSQRFSVACKSVCMCINVPTLLHCCCCLFECFVFVFDSSPDAFGAVAVLVLFQLLKLCFFFHFVFPRSFFFFFLIIKTYTMSYIFNYFVRTEATSIPNEVHKWAIFYTIWLRLM